MTSVLPGDWDGVVVICGAVPWAGQRMVDQQVASELTRYAPVLYVDYPVPWRPGRGTPTVAGPGGHGRSGVKLVQPRLALVTPHVLPGHERPGMKHVSVALVKRSMRRALADLGSPTVGALVLPAPNPYFGACDEQQKVFYASDDFVAGAELMGVPTSRLVREVEKCAAAADLIVAISPVLAEKFRAQGHDALMLPNGCDPDNYLETDSAEPAADVALEAPIAGFMGHISDRIDVRYLDAVARRGHSLLLVGPEPRGGLGEALQALVDRPNVSWVGPRPFENLPSYVRLMDVGLVTYTDTPFNHASFPLKALEYLAAGRPVLSTDIEAIHWLREGRSLRADGAGSPPITDDDIVIASSPEEFADAAERLMAQPRNEDAIRRRQAFAATHSWRERVDVLAEAMGLQLTSAD